MTNPPLLRRAHLALIGILAGAACASTSAPPTPRTAAATPACNAPTGDTSAVWREADVDRPVTPVSSVAPTYPASHARGSVLMAFVVDTLGTIEPCSLRVVHTSAPEFAAAVTAVLPKYRFSSAVRQGRRVRQFVELPFTFDVKP